MHPQRYCSPIWALDSGLFLPEDWSQHTFTHRVHNTIENIRRYILNPEVPVFVRGSLIEEKQPHPKSDIDIVILQQNKSIAVISPDIHTLGAQSIDINAFMVDTLEPREYLLPLIHLRSMQISGQVFVRKPVPVNERFWLPLWECYAVRRLSNSLCTTPPIRVMQLKQLIRAVGLIHLRQKGEFSRDIETCLEWLETYDWALGNHARWIWSQRSGVEPLNIAPIRHWIMDAWYALDG